MGANTGTPSAQLLAALAAAALASAAVADSRIDSAGNGFVGKGNVQSVFRWNSDQLQESAHAVRFRMGTSTVATWKCQSLGQTSRDEQGGVVVRIHDYIATLQSEVAVDTRDNRVGQVTGFNLNGFFSEYPVAIGACPNNNWVFVEDSLEYIQHGARSSSLQVSIDGMDWFDLR